MSDAVTVVSEALRKETLDYFNVKKEIKTVPNFIDMSLYQQKVDHNLRSNFAKEEEFLITHISNFRKVKRVKDVVKIFEKVNKEVPSKLLMIGDGPERIKAEELCRKLGLAKKVKFLGKLRIIEKMLAISDVFVLPSETESFGLVALEAMASNTAIISTNSGGISEANIEGGTGLLSNVGDVDKYKGYNFAIKNSELLKRFKSNALAHAKSFALKNVLPKYNTIYQSLCHAKKKK